MRKRQTMEDDDAPAPRFHFVGPLLARVRGRALRMGCLLFVVVVPVVMLRACTMRYVPPDQIALRQVSYGSGRGLQKKVVGTGYRRELFGYETIYTFPRDIQVVEFTNLPSGSARTHRAMPAINCPTVDGYPVSIDATVLYRIANPFLVVSKFGFGKAYEDSVVIRFTDPLVKHHLGELRAEEFYRDSRLKKVRDLKRELGQRLAENGLVLDDILIRQYDYPPTFQALTEQKKIQDQSVLTNIALAKQAEVQTRLNQVQAEGRNLINIKTADFQAQITGINAEQNLYERQKHAEADLLIRSAEASGNELVNRAMEGAGSDKLLRLRKGLAILNSIKGPIYISGDPTDLGKLSGNR
jgi:regulator of protease activity HflC (stomatin/prohibitin superfamily)